jgi:hypothetical protein
MNAVRMVAVVSAFCLSAMASAPASADTVETLVMMDAKGKTLGPVVELAGPFFKLPLVPFKVGESVFVLSIFKNKVTGSGNPVNLYFDNKTCDHKKGQVVAALDEIITKEAVRDEAFWSFVGTDGSTVYVPTPHAQQIKAFKVLSRLYVEQNGEVECQEYPKFIPIAVPASALENFMGAFTPPYSMGATTKK